MAVDIEVDTDRLVERIALPPGCDLCNADLDGSKKLRSNSQ